MEKILHKLDPGRLAAIELLFKQAHEALLKHDKKIDELFLDIEQHEDKLRRLMAHTDQIAVSGYRSDMEGGIRNYMERKAGRIGEFEQRLLNEKLAIEDLKKKIQDLKGEREYFQERVDQTQLLLESCREFAKENRL